MVKQREMAEEYMSQGAARGSSGARALSDSGGGSTSRRSSSSLPSVAMRAGDKGSKEGPDQGDDLWDKEEEAFTKCKDLAERYQVRVGSTWGDLPDDLQPAWR